MRKDPPFDMEYVYATHLLEYAQAQGAKVYNHGGAIRNHPEKLAITEFPEFTAPTLVTRDMARIKRVPCAASRRHRQAAGWHGWNGHFPPARRTSPTCNAILETLTDNGDADHHGAALHPGDRQGRQARAADRRRTGAVMRWRASRWRAKRAATWRPAAVGVAQPLSDRDRQLAAAVGPRLAARGLLLVGLDVIGDYVTEINVTSPTCFVEITEQTGFDVGDMLRRCARTRRRRVGEIRHDRHRHRRACAAGFGR